MTKKPKPKPVKLTEAEVAVMTWYSLVDNVRDRDKVIDGLIDKGLLGEISRTEWSVPIINDAGRAALKAARGKR